jgi:predicted XRE-type DNA-binding protein
MSTNIDHELFEGVTHETPADGNIFADLGFPPTEAESLLFRSRLMREIHVTIDERELTRKDAAMLFGVKQARITALKRGDIGAFTSDELIGMLGHAGMRVEVEIKPAD